MIDRPALLSDLQKLLQRLEADLLERSESAEVPEVGKTLRAEFERAKTAERTAQNYEDWRTDAITQAAAAWVLSCVFVRFLEDNRLLEPPKIAGPGERLARARDEHELYFRTNPRHTDREYLLAVFDHLATLPGTRDIFGPHNPIRELPNWLSGDAAGELLTFFQKIDAGTGNLVHDFTDPGWDTRFLGDLYQDLSEAARKKYALLQTPEFVEEFILDRTLNPALDEFGLTDFKMIDPACGSGHFLLGTFPRILGRWQRQEPGTNVRELVQRTLSSIHGVDVNPYAVAIARFRLLLAALRACDIARLDKGVPKWEMNLVCGDSLMHGSPGGDQQVLEFHELAHVYQSEDLADLRRILAPGRYHAVVANPPYITVKDKALNQAYRERYPEVCHMKYSLSVPFIQRLVDLTCPNGFTGQITSNSFMKREFGKKLIESYLPKWDLTHVIDTSLAFIPGHGTPTVILFARSRRPLARTIRAVMGIERENSEPTNAAEGLYWTAILDQVDQPGSQSRYISVNESPRDAFRTHPWSIGGGGASELKETLEANTAEKLESVIDSAGITSFTLEDDLFLLPESAARTKRLRREYLRVMIVGDVVRDWTIGPTDVAVFPYDATFQPIDEDSTDPILRYLWIGRTGLANNMMFGGKTKTQTGLKWYEYGRLTSDKLRTPFSIVVSFVATHNHFVLDRGGKVFKQSAPIIKLPANATEDEHLGLLGTLNCSTSCFWCRQVLHDKGGGGIGGGIAAETWERFLEFSATPLRGFPLPEIRPLLVSRRIDTIARKLAETLPDAVCRSGVPNAATLTQARERAVGFRGQMIALQEELDWQCYHLYGLADESLHNPNLDIAIELGQRAFEIVLARQMAAGEVETTWFTRHGSTPITEIPAHWPAEYRALVQRRIDLIESDKNIGLIEKPEYKRRWNTEPWEEQQERALRNWLLDRLESYFDFDGRMNAAGTPTAQTEIGLISVAQLADLAGRDADFHQVGAILKGDVAFDVLRLVTELVEAESVPLLPILRYKPSGLRKRAEWEQTWDLQRREDAGEKVGDIPVPPKYTSADFISSGGARYWSLRGKLDVPKERWISFPHCEGPDGTLMIAWAGYDHLQQAQAISAYYVRVQTELGGTGDPRLIPLLACLLELLPWLKQWHNEPSAAFDGMRMGDYFDGFITEEARGLNKTIPEIKGWTPPARTSGRGRRRS